MLAPPDSRKGSARRTVNTSSKATSVVWYSPSESERWRAEREHGQAHPGRLQETLKLNPYIPPRGFSMSHPVLFPPNTLTQIFWIQMLTVMAVFVSLLSFLVSNSLYQVFPVFVYGLWGLDSYLSLFWCHTTWNSPHPIFVFPFS